jgi:serine/threonine-protein kinase RsbW
LDREGASPHTLHRSGEAAAAFLDRLLDDLDAFLMDSAAVADEDRALFLLAVSEVVSNVIAHGGPGVRVTAAVEILPREVRARIDDTAPPALIDWDRVALPSEQAESGRGLAIALAVLDELRHESAGTGNVWLLRRSFAA